MAIFEVIKGVASQYLLDTAGLWALLALIPLIIVYLIRPKPKKQTVPALMFLMKESAKSDKSSFLRNFVRDPLFLFQLLVLIVFAIAIAKPFLTVTEDLLAEKTALVVDASASSQVEIEGMTRFERAIEIAKDNVGSNNAIIAISSVPELIADDVDAPKARDELDHIKPRDTPTSVFDSLIFASNYVKEKDKIIVISDFIETGTEKDFNAAKSIIESKGIIVDFVNTRDLEERKARNIGIVDMDVTEETTSVQIKNYNDINETVRLTMEGVSLSTDQITIEPKAVEVVSFPTPGSLSKFSIHPSEGHDDFPLDNDLYTSSPSREPAPLLLIANSVTKNLKTALDVIDTVTAERGTPPKVPEINHQIIMINNIQKDLLLPGTMKSIRKKVDEGAALIIVAQPDIMSVDFEGMMPVERAENSGPVLIDHEVWVTPFMQTSITEDINFGMVKKYLKVVPLSGSTVLASTTNDVPMIVMKNYGKGMVMYFGMMDDQSTFKDDIYYPVFWKRVFDMAIKKQDLTELNFRTGKLLNLLVKQKIEAPYGKVEAETIMLSHQGIYRGEVKNFVANLLNDDESDINGEEFDKKIGVFEEETKKEKIPFELTRHFIIGLLVLIFLELLWIKFRGDL